MESQSILSKIILFFLSPFNSKTLFINVKEDNEWRRKAVLGPISFSQLDELFGEGCWKL
jgi:hypothetical protein